jgi:tRNA1(Val) A37 N6-methylase TrmN6
MEQLTNGFTLHIPQGCFPLSTDSMLLSDFVRPGKNSRVLDLGAGCGTLGLLLCAKDPGCKVTGIELEETAHLAAVENIRRNALAHRMESICGDLRDLPQELAGKYSICVSNPPYFTGGPASVATPTARRTDTCNTDQLFHAAAAGLKYGGDFYLVHRPESLAELCAAASRHGMEPKVLRIIRHTLGGPVTLILLKCRKGGKPGLAWEERTMHDGQGAPTDYFREIYHL